MTARRPILATPHEGLCLTLCVVALLGAACTEPHESRSDHPSDAAVLDALGFHPPESGPVERTDSGHARDVAIPAQDADLPPPSPTRDGGVDAALASVSEYCGDGIRDPQDEECDDGNQRENDLCTRRCTARDTLLGSENGDVGGWGLTPSPHGIGGEAKQYGVAMVDQGSDHDIWVQRYSDNGTVLGEPLRISQDGVPTAAPDPAVAGLPDGRLVVAWADARHGGSDVVLTTIDLDGRLEHERANAFSAGAQGRPDAVWTGNELIVAWDDLLDVEVRRFDARLQPIGPERALGTADSVDSAPALAPFRGSYALAYRAGKDGRESIRVAFDGASWWTTPALPLGPAGARPALVSLSDERLLLLFVAGRDYQGSGSSQLFGAVIEPDLPGAVELFPWPSHSGEMVTIAQYRPQAAVLGTDLHVGWVEQTTGGFTTVVSRVLNVAWTFDKGFSDFPSQSPTAVRPTAASLCLASVPARPGASLAVAWGELAPGVQTPLRLWLRVQRER